jgi:hypothetical protein
MSAAGKQQQYRSPLDNTCSGDSLSVGDCKAYQSSVRHVHVQRVRSLYRSFLKMAKVTVIRSFMLNGELNVVGSSCEIAIPQILVTHNPLRASGVPV